VVRPPRFCVKLLGVCTSCCTLPNAHALRAQLSRALPPQSHGGLRRFFVHAVNCPPRTCFPGRPRSRLTNDRTTCALAGSVARGSDSNKVPYHMRQQQHWKSLGLPGHFKVRRICWALARQCTRAFLCASARAVAMHSWRPHMPTFPCGLLTYANAFYAQPADGNDGVRRFAEYQPTG
jgi:hypothetical protein